MRFIPNVISIIRLALVPYIVSLILDHQYARALTFCFIAGGSDLLDGYLARRFGWTSRLGAFLDPIADKLLLSIIFPVMAYVGRAPWWLAATVVARDLAIVLGSFIVWLMVRQRDFPPTKAGKWSTTVQILAVIVILGLFAPWFEPPMHYAVAAMAIYSLYTYILQARDMIHLGRQN